jgi:hypothetical protein
MTISWNFQDTVHTEMNDTTRTAREYEPGGKVLIRTRPYTAEENALVNEREAFEAARDADITTRQELDAKTKAIVSAIAATTVEKPGNGAAWVKPTGAQDAYAKDAEVTRNGKTWVSLTPYNVWEPGVAAWREKAASGGGYPAWVQPTGSSDAYPMNAKVSHKGSNWENTGSTANVWEPGVFGWVTIP